MQPDVFHVKVSDGRRVVLPAEACERLKVGVGDTVIVQVAEEGVRLESTESVVKNFRRLLREKVPPGVSLVDELLAERRQDAERE